MGEKRRKRGEKGRKGKKKGKKGEKKSPTRKKLYFIDDFFILKRAFSKNPRQNGAAQIFFCERSER